MFKEFAIEQRPKEPPRKFFTDEKHFDLFVWYADPGMTQVSGFQLGYRANYFNTDDEIILTHKPDVVTMVGEIRPTTPNYPGPKIIHPTNKNVPPQLLTKLRQIANTLPHEVSAFLLSHLPPS